MSYDDIFRRLNDKLTSMTEEAISPYLGEKVSETMLDMVAKAAHDAYSRFYDECTHVERELLDMQHPALLVGEVTVQLGNVNVVLVRKDEYES